MVGQLGVLWFVVIDVQGIIIFYSDFDKVGCAFYSLDEMQKLKLEENFCWWLFGKMEITFVFEVYCLFQLMLVFWWYGMYNMLCCNGKVVL